MPSLASSVAITDSNASFSASMPAASDASAPSALIAASARAGRAASLPGPGQRAVVKFVVVDQAAREPEFPGLLGEHGVADGVHLEGLRDADEPRQALGAAEAGDDPELDLRLPEHRRAGRDPHVAGHRELAAAAERERVDGGDRRQRPGAEIA